MAEPRTPPAARLPTLTEVVSVAAAHASARPHAGDEVAAPAGDGEARLVAEVMAELQPRIDLMFEYRVREALAPLLARLADAVIREARDELANTLRDVVARAVAQEVARRRNR